MDPFRTNPEKAAARININNILMAACVAVLGVSWTISSHRLYPFIIGQLMIAVPLLYVSSLSYAKIAYWHQTKLWDAFGWFTGTTATACIFNTLGIMALAGGYRALGIAYFLVQWILLLVYTAINVHYRPETVASKTFKYVFFVGLQLTFGLLLPLAT